MGPGGEEVAGRLAEAGLAVAGAESRLVGGECPYFGCIPSKMMIRAANLLAETARVNGMAGQASAERSWDPVARRIRQEATDDWDGTVPAVPPIPGLAGTPYWTNREAIKATRVPESLIVLGGGAIGVELAQVFGRFGARVTVVEALSRLVPPEEPEAGELLAAVFLGQGIDVRTGLLASQVSHENGTFRVTMADGEVLTAAGLLVAAGRRVNLADVGVGAVGIDENAPFIRTDERMRAAPGVWAIGDIVGHGAFTHMSMYHAGIVIADILGQEHRGAEYHAVPRVTFTDPEIGSVGITEAQARDQGIDVRTGLSQIPSSARGWIHKVGNEGFIKLVLDPSRGILVGATSVGPVGGEVLSMLTLSVHARIPVQRLREMIYAYPTFHRAVEDALRDLG